MPFCHAQQENPFQPSTSIIASQALDKHTQHSSKAQSATLDTHGKSQSQHKNKKRPNKSGKSALSRKIAGYLKATRAALWGKNGWSAHYLRRLITASFTVVGGNLIKDLYLLRLYNDKIVRVNSNELKVFLDERISRKSKREAKRQELRNNLREKLDKLCSERKQRGLGRGVQQVYHALLPAMENVRNVAGCNFLISKMGYDKWSNAVCQNDQDLMNRILTSRPGKLFSGKTINGHLFRAIFNYNNLAALAMLIEKANERNENINEVDDSLSSGKTLLDKYLQHFETIPCRHDPLMVQLLIDSGATVSPHIVWPVGLRCPSRHSYWKLPHSLRFNQLSRELRKQHDAWPDIVRILISERKVIQMSDADALRRAVQLNLTEEARDIVFDVLEQEPLLIDLVLKNQDSDVVPEFLRAIREYKNVHYTLVQDATSTPSVIAFIIHHYIFPERQKQDNKPLEAEEREGEA